MPYVISLTLTMLAVEIQARLISCFSSYRLTRKQLCCFMLTFVCVTPFSYATDGVQSKDQASIKPELSTAPNFSQWLLDAESKLPSDMRATNALLLYVTESSPSLTTTQQFRLVLLQAYRNILLGQLDIADGQLDVIEKENAMLEVFSRILYFRAIIAKKRMDYEQVFLLLNRVDQLDTVGLLYNHQFDVYTLASMIHAQANAKDNALGYANKALEIATENNNSLLQCRAHNSLSFLYQSTEKFAELFLSANNVIKLCDSEKEAGELAHAYVYLAGWYSNAQESSEETNLV